MTGSVLLLPYVLSRLGHRFNVYCQNAFIPGEERRAGDPRALGRVPAVSGSGADTADTGVAVAAAAAAVVSPMVVGEVAAVAGAGVVVAAAAAAAAVVGEPVAVVGENLLRGRQRRGLFPGRLSKAAGFPEGLRPAESNISVVLSTLSVGWRQTVLYTSHHCWA